MRASERVQSPRTILLHEGLAFAKEKEMNLLKSIVAAGALAAAALTTTTAADAAPKIVVGNTHGHGHVIAVKPGHGPAIRKPVAVFGGWYAAPNVYRPYTYFRANPRLRACFLVTQRGFHGRRAAVFGATMCYGKNGVRYIVPASRHFVRFG
jgi:hypothetical protein